MALSFSDAAAQAVQGAACSLLALSDEATRWINSAIGADGNFGNIAGSLRKTVCNESNPTGSYGPEIPFTGGQCAVLYDIVVEYIRPGESIVRQGFGSATGPITDGFWEKPGSSWNYVVIANGSPRIIDSTNASGEPDTQSVTLTRRDGQPDNCGDPPGIVGDYNDYSQTVSITYEDNTQTEITEDVDITLGPLIVGIGGVLYAPVTVGVGDITLNGTVELSPEFSVELFPDGLFGGGGNTDGPVPNPSEPDPSPTTPDDRRRIIGAVVTVTALDQDVFQGTQIAQGNTPDLLVPRVGNISFYVESSGGLAWTEPTAVKTVRAYVPCPAREGAVDVAITPETGVIADVKPVYVDLAVAD
jgi:hypothetical protein